MHRAPTLLFCVLFGFKIIIIYSTKFCKILLFEEKVISYWMGGGRLDSHFHGNDRKKRGDDMREVGKIVLPFYYEIATDDVQY